MPAAVQRPFAPPPCPAGVGCVRSSVVGVVHSSGAPWGAEALLLRSGEEEGRLEGRLEGSRETNFNYANTANVSLAHQYAEAFEVACSASLRIPQAEPV